MTETDVSFSLSIFCPMGSRWKTSPIHHRPPLHLRGAANPRRPHQAGWPGRLLQGRPPQRAFSDAVRVRRRGGDETTTTVQPRQLSPVPPTLPAPRPCTSSWPLPPPHSFKPSSSETASEAVYASFAEVAKRMLAVRALRSPRVAAAERR